jgi:DNA polymerase III subunit beta
MEFSVNKADLVRELSLSQGVVEKKTTIPILSNVLVEAVGDRIHMTATDLELGIRCSCPATVQREGSGTIPARKLLDYVRLLPDVELQVKFGDNQWASIVCGRSRSRIAGMSRESYPELPTMPDTIAELPLSILAGMIARTIFAISAEESRFTLNGALLFLRTSGVVMVATDGHRLSMVEVKKELPGLSSDYRALLPRKAMQELQKLAQDASGDAMVAFSADDNHLFFQVGDRLLISRKLTGTFPDYERVLPKEQPYMVELDRDVLRAAIERVSQFSDERSRAIRLQFLPGEVKVHSSLSETGEGEETLPATYDGPKIEVGFNAHYLLEFTRALSETKSTFHFRDSQSAGEMRPSGGDADTIYRYVVMPMRI